MSAVHHNLTSWCLIAVSFVSQYINGKTVPVHNYYDKKP